jgi:hypothetical protein
VFEVFIGSATAGNGKYQWQQGNQYLWQHPAELEFGLHIKADLLLWRRIYYFQ